MCGRALKTFCMVSALLLLVLLPTYSLDEGEAQELTQILTELNSGLTKVESGLNQASENQKALEKDLTMLNGKTKELEADLHEQKKVQLRLEAQLQNLSNSYDDMARDNRRLKWIAGGLAGTTLLALFAAVLL